MPSFFLWREKISLDLLVQTRQMSWEQHYNLSLWWHFIWYSLVGVYWVAFSFPTSYCNTSWWHFSMGCVRIRITHLRPALHNSQAKEKIANWVRATTDTRSGVCGRTSGRWTQSFWGKSDTGKKNIRSRSFLSEGFFIWGRAATYMNCLFCSVSSHTFNGMKMKVLHSWLYLLLS